MGANMLAPPPTQQCPQPAQSSARMEIDEERVPYSIPLPATPESSIGKSPVQNVSALPGSSANDCRTVQHIPSLSPRSQAQSRSPSGVSSIVEPTSRYNTVPDNLWNLQDIDQDIDDLLRRGREVQDLCCPSEAHQLTSLLRMEVSLSKGDVCPRLSTMTLLVCRTLSSRLTQALRYNPST
jgi:hypothetical protein